MGNSRLSGFGCWSFEATGACTIVYSGPSGVGYALHAETKALLYGLRLLRSR